MRTETSKGFLRLHYKAPDYQFGQVELEFELQAHRTMVQSVIEVMPSPHTKASAGEIPLVLDGQDVEFISLRINGQAHRHVLETFVHLGCDQRFRKFVENEFGKCFPDFLANDHL